MRRGCWTSSSATILPNVDTFRLLVRACLPLAFTGVFFAASSISRSGGGKVCAERVTRRSGIGSGTSSSSMISMGAGLVVEIVRLGLVDARRLFRGAAPVLVSATLSFEVYSPVRGDDLTSSTVCDVMRVDFLRLLGGGDSTEVNISSSSSSILCCRVNLRFVFCCFCGVTMRSGPPPDFLRVRVGAGSDFADLTGEDVVEGGRELWSPVKNAQFGCRFLCSCLSS